MRRANQKVRAKFESEKGLEAAILAEKARGTPDAEIGRKYGVTFRYIERLITRTQGLNVSVLARVAGGKRIKRLAPKGFSAERTTVWSFKQRGDWATHSGEYRGNWSPYIPRNVILRYSKPGETVLDYFCGAGTTAVEAKLLGRRCVALDINEKAIALARKNLDFDPRPTQPALLGEQAPARFYEPKLLVGDARDLAFLEDESIDLICAHPPYANIIHYTAGKEGDLSYLDVDEFLKEMARVAGESFRVLKPGRQCAILIGDLRRRGHVVPLGFKLIDVYRAAGFKLRELVIKRQHNCKTTGFWYERSIKYNFLLLAHEYLPIFEKPAARLSFKTGEPAAEYEVRLALRQRPVRKSRVERLETTTVWSFPASGFEGYLNTNVIERYSGGNGYSAITFVGNAKTGEGLIERGGKRNSALLFIKSPFLNGDLSHSNIADYLHKINQTVCRELPGINRGGFLVIQTRDVRVGGYIEPLAKRIVDMLTDDRLWLKEIIIVTQENGDSADREPGDYLKINHRYLLVYEVKG